MRLSTTWRHLAATAGMFVCAAMPLLAHAAPPATAPAPPPGPPPATQPTAVLLNGKIEYTPPPWKTVESKFPAETTAIYASEVNDGFLDIQVLPENALITPAAAAKIVGQLRANHKKAGQDLVEGPKVEQDKRFAIKIHERYKTKEGKIADETHLYRQVGGRALELDVQSLSENPDEVAVVRAAGEDVLVSARWKVNRPAKPKPKGG